MQGSCTGLFPIWDGLEKIFSYGTIEISFFVQVI
jgi:hypothetical protein